MERVRKETIRVLWMLQALDVIEVVLADDQEVDYIEGTALIDICGVNEG